MTLHVQFVTLGMMCFGGLSLGTMFDLYRVLAGQLKAPSWLKSLLDLLYWFIGTIVVFLLLYESNWGEIRPFIFLGLGIGICLYFLLFSRYIVRFILILIKVTKAVCHFIVKMVKLLIIKPAIGMYRVVVIILGFLAATAVFLYKIVIQLIKPVWKIMLWLGRRIGSVLRIRMPKLTGLHAAWTRILSWFKRR